MMLGLKGSEYLFLIAVGALADRFMPDLPSWVLIAALVSVGAMYIAQVMHRDKDDKPPTKGDIAGIEKRLGDRLFKVSALQSLAANLPQEPIGTDGTTWAELPEGTRIVVAPDGTLSLATPVNVKLGPVSASEPSATLKVTVAGDSA